MSRRSLGVLVGIYAAIALAVGLAVGWVGALLVVFLAGLATAIGLGASVGGDWFRDASAGRFRDDGRRS
jgi:hypothetical protein